MINKTEIKQITSSLLQGRNLLCQGLRFIIGNGQAVDVWKDPWLAVSPPRPPIPKHDTYPPMHMSDLIQFSPLRWNAEKIREFVDPMDVDHILKIKLGTQPSKDILGWHYTKDGLYSVKTGYGLATQLVHATSPPLPGSCWIKQKLWKMQTPSKIHHFLCKILTNILPVGETLHRRHITALGPCKRCCQSEETTNHLFFDCIYAQQVWRGVGFSPVFFGTNTTVEERLDKLFTMNLGTGNLTSRHLPIWCLWKLWKSRNLLYFQQRQQSWQQTLTYAQHDTTEWLDREAYLATIDSPRLPPQHSPPSTLWRRPSEDWIKCNVDASFTSPVSFPQAGWILRDHKGTYLGACQARGNQVNCALESECQALLQAMQHCWSKGYSRIIFEGDCQELFNVLHCKSLNFGMHNWIKDIRFWSSKFQEVLFQWIPRSGNKVADMLARRPMNQDTLFTYFYFVPSYIVPLIHTDYCNSQSD